MRVTRLLGRLLGPIFGGRTGYLVLALLIALGILAVFRPNYFTLSNVRVIMLNMASIGIASVGMALLIIAGSIDLAIGAMFAVTAFTAAFLAAQAPAPVAIVGGVGLGALLGWLNGLVVWRIKVSPIIVTLGAATLLRGVLLVLTSGRGVQNVPESFTTLGRAVPLGVPAQVWILLGIAVIGHVLLSKTTVGRHIYAIGGNREASAVAGINVRGIILRLFAINGLLTAVAAVLAASRFGTASTQFGIGFELDVVTAVILGGVAFTGGEGSIAGVMLAVIFLGVVSSGLISLGVDPFYTDVVKGGALILSVALDQLTQERRERYRKQVAMADFAAQVTEARATAQVAGGR